MTTPPTPRPRVVGPVDAEPSLLARAAPLIALGLLGLLLWQLSSVVLLFFGATVLAVLLRALAAPIQRRTPLGPGLSLGLVVVLIVIVVGGGIALFGYRVTIQMDTIFSRLPGAWAWVKANLLQTRVGRYVLANVEPSSFLSGSSVVTRVGAFANTGANAVTDILLVIVGGVYLAIDPKLYVEGGLKLFSRQVRPSIRRAVEESGKALRQWLFGQLIAMILIGLLTGVGLAVIGTPSALTLGLFAGLAEFLPLIGPLLGAVPALLIAVSVSPHQVLWTAVLFLAIQQIEGNALQPQIQKRIVSIPPVVGLFGLAVFGVLFGFIGLILAAPLTVFAVVCIKALYVRDALGEDIDPLKS